MKSKKLNKQKPVDIQRIDWDWWLPEQGVGTWVGA